MKQALAETQKDFDTSSGKTPEYLSWHRLFKRQLTEFLTSIGGKEIDVRKPNHFDLSGFFTSASGQIWYFRVEHIRWSKNQMLVRTAKSTTDYTGGRNQSVSLTNADDFVKQFEIVMSRPW